MKFPPTAIFRHRRFWASLVLAVVVVTVVGWRFQHIALPDDLFRSPPATPVLVDLHGRVISVAATDLARDSRPISLAAMGPWLPSMTVAIEDHRFFHHCGMDFHALGGATWRNLSHGRVISGASTITQQLVKICSPRTSRTLTVKAREALAALRLEHLWNKSQILEAYLNRIDYGNRRLGAEAAARAYFGKAAADLNLSEAIYLAGLPQSPVRLNPWKNPDQALARYERNVRCLAAQGDLPTSVDAVKLAASPPRVGQNPPPAVARHFAALVEDTRTESILRQTGAGRPVSTTLDLDLQETVRRLARAHRTAMSGQGVGDLAVVVLENATGAVRAMVSVGPAEHAAFNAAIIPRSCGSTLKPFLYLAAIDRHLLTAASLLPDTPDAVPATYGDYDPQNFSHRYHGPVRVREALGNSMNVPAVVTLARMGARPTFAGLRAWGLNFPGTLTDYGAGFILGNAPVRLLDLAAAYAGLARGGAAWAARLTPQDSVEIRHPTSTEACTIITDILCDNDARRLSFGPASPLHLEQRTAVKTGTSSGFRDGWCVGFNGRHTVAVWAGNLDGRGMGELLSVHSAAPLWAAVMEALYASGDPAVPEPEESPVLRTLRVAAQSGQLPRPGEKTIQEWFLTGTEPATNAADSYINGIWQLPDNYAEWCAGAFNHLGAKVRHDDLKILFPQDGAVFEFNPHLPAGQQTLLLQATTADCQWKLNGKPLETPQVMLTRGDWHLTATSGGKSTTTSFTVK